MSRVGKNPIAIPAGVEVKINPQEIFVKGPKGELKQFLHPEILIEQKDNQLLVSIKNLNDHKNRALWGLFRSLLNNMVVGVTVGFQKQLEINGIGFKASVSGNKLILNVGFSHPVQFDLPVGIKGAVEKNVITINGCDKQVVGEVAANIRKVKKPEPYNGKGIKYLDEVIIRKAGKTAGKTGE